LVRAVPARTVLAGGFAVATVGLGWLVLTLGGDSYAADLLPGLLISGFGHGMIYTSMFIIGTRDVPGSHQGAAGSLLTTAQYVSGAVTVAVLTLVLDGYGFRWAFAVTAVAALSGVLVALPPRAGRGAPENVVPPRQDVVHGR
jgi:MFS family permease